MSSEPTQSPAPEGATLRVLVVDDHPLTRASVFDLLESAERLHPVGVAANAEEGLDLAREMEPDVVVMDVSMPGMSGIEATRRLVADRCAARVLLFSGESSPAAIRAAQEAGAAGFIIKGGRTATLLHAIRAVGAGGSVWPAGEYG